MSAVWAGASFHGCDVALVSGSGVRPDNRWPVGQGGPRSRCGPGEHGKVCETGAGVPPRPVGGAN
eukprot:23145-Eustigmatos_ZCMA.PRE.1